MIIEPKVRGFICTTAHPKGCEKNVENQIQYVLSHKKNLQKGPQNVLVIGASTGYGLASRIVSAFGYQASTIGVSFERPSENERTATAGWYNTAGFEKFALEKGLYTKSLNGDAFSDEIKQKTIELIQKDLKKIDLVIYSLASPKRTHPVTKQTYNSVLKPLRGTYTEKTVNPLNGEIRTVTIEPANEIDIQNTIQVMGGEDWEMWIDALKKANVLAEGVKTVAYSYIGPKLTYPIYWEGTIGKAKDHLEGMAKILNEKLKSLHGCATVSVNKAVVTQSSAAIPVVPLYISLLFKVMKEKNIHEDCIEQIQRLFEDILYVKNSDQKQIPVLVRVDDWEMRPDVQSAVADLWNKIDSQNIYEISDLKGYKEDFYRLFGFGLKGLNYSEESHLGVEIPSIS